MAIIQFPQNFKWGSATAAYQIEGAAEVDGRGPSIWDTFSKTPGKIRNGDNGDVACGSYYKYREDVELLDDLGADIYRFSVSWPRIFPQGTGEINQKGVDYYHRLIDALLEKGIEPMLTLYHWDLPQALQDKGGWGNRDTIQAFVDYATFMFKEFNGKVKYWITLNEPWCVAFLSNFIGEHAPGNRDPQLALQISHNLMVAHGATVKKFRELNIDGQIGYAPNTTWLEPYSNRQEDIDACRREVGIYIDWFMDPVFKGEYPQFLLDWFAERGFKLDIAEGDLETIHQPIDFLGINYYTGHVAKYKENEGAFHHEMVEYGYERTDIGWPIYPNGLYHVLLTIKDKYGDVPIFITENGACYNDEPVNGEVKDHKRIEYLKKHLISVDRSIKSGVNVKGYLVWSLLDNFEWAYGYSMRFGIVHVNFRTLERTKKDSFYWMKQTIKNNWFEV